MVRGHVTCHMSCAWCAYGACALLLRASHLPSAFSNTQKNRKYKKDEKKREKKSNGRVGTNSQQPVLVAVASISTPMPQPLSVHTDRRRLIELRPLLFCRRCVESVACVLLLRIFAALPLVVVVESVEEFIPPLKKGATPSRSRR